MPKAELLKNLHIGGNCGIPRVVRLTELEKNMEYQTSLNVYSIERFLTSLRNLDPNAHQGMTYGGILIGVTYEIFGSQDLLPVFDYLRTLETATHSVHLNSNYRRRIKKTISRIRTIISLVNFPNSANHLSQVKPLLDVVLEEMSDLVEIESPEIDQSILNDVTNGINSLREKLLSNMKVDYFEKEIVLGCLDLCWESVGNIQRYGAADFNRKLVCAYGQIQLILKEHKNISKPTSDELRDALDDVLRFINITQVGFGVIGLIAHQSQIIGLLPPPG